MNVDEVQRRLWKQSKAHRENREASTPLFPTNPYDMRVRNLSDLIHHPEWLGEAAERVFKRSKNKAPGVDGVTVAKFLKHGPENAQKLRMELKNGTYQPQPLKRVEIGDVHLESRDRRRSFKGNTLKIEEVKDDFVITPFCSSLHGEKARLLSAEIQNFRARPAEFTIIG